MMISSIIMKILAWTLYIFAFCYTKRVNPIKYIIDESPLQKYGSSETGHCSNTSVTVDGGLVCTTPQSSVLFDGVIPSLTERNSNMRWASQLLVLNVSTTITFEISDPSSGIEAFGIVILNCPQENIGGATKVILQYRGYTLNKPISHMSCDHLIRLCGVFTPKITNTFTLSFEVSSAAQFPLAFYFAEISLYDSTLDCRLSGIIDTPTSSTTSRFQDFEPEHNTETKLPITSGTQNMKMSEDSNSTVPSTTNFTTSSVRINTTSTTSVVPIIIAVVVLLLLLSLIVPLVIIITNRKRNLLTKHCSDLLSTTKIEKRPETGKSSDDCSHHGIGGNECNFDTYAQVLEKKVDNNGRESIAAIHNDPDPTKLYAKVDTTRKKKPKAVVEVSSPNTSEMYAVVNKKAKQYQEKGELNGNQDSSELYSVVDKTKKKKNLKNNNKDTKELYSVVNKAKIKESAQEVSQLL